MRGVLLSLIAVGLVTGCGCSKTGIQGHADSILDTVPELTPDPDPDDEPEIIEDIAEEEWPATTEGCGNGVVEDEEECDDGDLNDCNGCSSECRWQRAMRVEGGIRGAYVASDLVPPLTEPLTIEAWFKLDRISMFPTQSILFQPLCYSFSVQVRDVTGNVAFYYSGHSISGGAQLDVEGSLEPSTWHHMALTYGLFDEVWEDRLFLDGHQIYSQIISGWERGWDCEEELTLAGIQNTSDPTGDAVFWGAVDDVRYSDAALYDEDFTPERRLEVRPDTVALWSFNQEIDGVIPDISGNGHDAVLVEGTLVPDDCHLP